MKYVLCYDIADDRRLRRVVKIMEGCGYRVQKSVFEGFFTPAELNELFKSVKQVIDEKEDSVRVYRLCEPCDRAVNIIGIGDRIEAKPYIVL